MTAKVRLPKGLYSALKRTAMSGYDPSRHRRRSIRLRGYDYTQPGAYFVTICTHNREPLFGKVVAGEMVLNAWGRIVREEWFRSAEIRAEIELFPDEFVVMPNHIHGIIWIVGDMIGVQRRCTPIKPSGGVTPNNVTPGSLGAMVTHQRLTGHAGCAGVATQLLRTHYPE